MSSFSRDYRPDSVIEWINNNQNDVTILIIKHLTEKAILKQTTSISEIVSLIKNTYSVCMNRDTPILDVLVSSLDLVYLWEKENSTVCLSSLIICNHGEYNGLPNKYFWRAKGCDNLTFEDKTKIIKNLHNVVFNHYSVLTSKFKIETVKQENDQQFDIVEEYVNHR